jgi:hypothetical protein
MLTRPFNRSARHTNELGTSLIEPVKSKSPVIIFKSAIIELRNLPLVLAAALRHHGDRHSLPTTIRREKAEAETWRALDIHWRNSRLFMRRLTFPSIPNRFTSSPRFAKGNWLLTELHLTRTRKKTFHSLLMSCWCQVAKTASQFIHFADQDPRLVCKLEHFLG